MIRILISTGLFLFTFSVLMAQEEELSPYDFFLDGFYKDAIKGYKKILQKDPANFDANRKIGICYLSVSGDKGRAIDHLEFVRNNDKANSRNEELLIDLASAYHQAYRFDEAIKVYQELRMITTSKNYPFVDRQIEICKNAIELFAKPVNVTFVNLGKEVNSTEDDYYPFVTTDESYLVFTTRRKGTTGNLTGLNGLFTSDIYFSTVIDGKWSKAKSLSPIVNTAEDEQAVGMSTDANNLMVYQETPEVYGDIYISTKIKGKYVKPEKFGPSINTKDMETEAYIMPDGKTMYFVSNKLGGIGKADIYLVKKDVDGNWGVPENLGNVINTDDDEGFPRLTDDGKTLYFASKGHKTMGGFDIFRSYWDESKKEWTKPENVGYPINNPDNNMVFSLCSNNRDAYVSMYRKEDSMGELDIYKVIFNEVEERKTALKGLVTFEGIETKDIKVHLKVYNDTLLVTDRDINFKTERFTVNLEPGKYKFLLETEKYPKIEEQIKILGMSNYKEEVEKVFNFSFQPAELKNEKKSAPAKAPLKK
jgi:hypothetical protein